MFLTLNKLLCDNLTDMQISSLLSWVKSFKPKLKIFFIAAASQLIYYYFAEIKWQFYHLILT